MVYEQCICISTPHHLIICIDLHWLRLFHFRMIRHVDSSLNNCNPVRDLSICNPGPRYRFLGRPLRQLGPTAVAVLPGAVAAAAVLGEYRRKVITAGINLSNNLFCMKAPAQDNSDAFLTVCIIWAFITLFCGNPIANFAPGRPIIPPQTALRTIINKRSGKQIAALQKLRRSNGGPVCEFRPG